MLSPVTTKTESRRTLRPHKEKDMTNTQFHIDPFKEPTEPSSTEIFSLSLDEFYSPLSKHPSEHDAILQQANRDPLQLTARLRELVPLLDFVDFRPESVTEHETIGAVPLRASAMNQNGTHQASVFYLMSDYISGVAMWSALVGTYTVGVHDRCAGQPIQFWLKSNHVHHLRPGTGTMWGRASISDEYRADMRERLLAKGRCEVLLHVDIFQGDDLIATADPVMGAYLDNPRMPERKADLFQRENSKLSAKMIAGVRSNPESQAVAGEQGRALGLRFAEVTPQLPHMIEARGRHLTQHLEQVGNRYEQVVVLGVGLDTNPLRFGQSGQRWFGLDLRHTLQIRKEAFAAVGGDAPMLTLVSVDLRLNQWGQALIEAGFDPLRSTLFVLEGISPYLHESELARLFSSVYPLCQHMQSRLWLDHVTPELFQLDLPEVQGFFFAISRLGEPFVTGFKTVEAVTDAWRTCEQHTAEEILDGDHFPHPVYEHHLVSVVEPKVSHS